jgi:MFS family permease
MIVTNANAGAAESAAISTGYGSARYRVYVLIVLTLVYTLNFIDRILVSVLAQPIIAAFQLSDSQYGFLSGPPFAIFYALLGIPIAVAADRYNRVRIVALSIAVWSVMTALCGFATSFLFLLVARIGVAIGEAGSTPPSNSIIGDYFIPRQRAAALGVFAMGVTIGSALANYLGGGVVRALDGPALAGMLSSGGWDWMLGVTDWSRVEGWRIAFVAIGAPGILVALLMLFTVREPPRGYSDPSGAGRAQRAGIAETFRELAGKPTFWFMSIGASLVALVGYGVIGFQAPMAQRLHGIGPGEFAVEFGGPLALVASVGTFACGMLVARISHRVRRAVALVPTAGLLLSLPFYLYAFYSSTEEFRGLGRAALCFAFFFHYTYMGSQYTIAQGVVPARSRASAVAILLLLIALIGNGLGPQVVGWLSDAFMAMRLESSGAGGALTTALCRDAAEVARLSPDLQLICRQAYGEGLRSSMVATVSILLPAALCFYLSSRTLERDMVAGVR